MADNVVRLLPSRPCPICGKPSTQAHHPFCSGRCADIDLSRWLSGAYVIPAEPVDDEEESATIPGGGDAGDDES